jgi:tetratricopeptide (TPR) repeat protein
LHPIRQTKRRGIMIRTILKCAVACGVIGAADHASAGEVPLIAPVPGWVEPVPGIDLTMLPTRNAAIPIFDEQTLVDGDMTVQYIETAVTIGNQGLLGQLGTISMAWQPQHGDLSIHAVEIVRGAERIDLLKSGPGFTVLRREAKLERQSIDGQLTAMMPAQGLRIGDILRVAFSISIRDDALAGRAQTAQLLIARPATMDFGRARLVWPKGQKLAWKSLTPGIEPVLSTTAGGMEQLVVALPIAKIPEQPKNIPARFVPVPAIEASSFTDWEDVAKVMAPLYRTEGLIAEGSELAALVDRIKASDGDPLRRASAALRMVQDDVRYQLVALGNGNYVPQKPAETLALRFGDCKAKTLLLVAMLRRMGIEAEAVLAASVLGDLVPARLPAAQAFDHVFVRAVIAGESVWLDGTRVGDRFADIRDVPRFGSVLPLRETGAGLLRLPTRADARPASEVTIAFDGSAGVHLPMPFTMKETYNGYRAEQQRAQVEGGSAESLREFAEKETKRLVDSTTIVDPKASYDKESGSWTLEVSGVAYPDWQFQDGRWAIEYGPKVQIDFTPDRSKSVWRQIPALISDPWTVRSAWSLTLPERARNAVLEGTDPIALDLPAVSYRRTTSRNGLTISSVETSGETGAEIPPADIGAARKAVEDVTGKMLRIIAPAAYPQRWDEAAALAKGNSPALKRIKAIFDKRIGDEPKDGERYSDRAWLAKRMLDWAAAEADYSQAIALDPTVDNYVARSGVRSERGDFAGALADARLAFEIDSANKEARDQLVVALGNLDKFDEALDLIEESPDPMSDDGSRMIATRADVLAKGGRLPDAVALLDGAIERRPSLAWYRNSRCWLRALANVDLDQALADCDKSIELASDPAAYYDSRALVHFRAGRPTEAKADLDAALAISPELVSSRFMRGIIATREGDKARAAAELGAARKLWPSIDTYFARWGIKP